MVPQRLLSTSVLWQFVPVLPRQKGLSCLWSSAGSAGQPSSATLLRNLSGDVDLADGGCYLIPQKCFVIEKMETV